MEGGDFPPPKARVRITVVNALSDETKASFTKLAFGDARMPLSEQKSIGYAIG
jgi:hypothetical protein